MADRRDEDRARIAVAAPRLPTRQLQGRGGRPVGSASEAGLSLIAVIALVAVVGWAVGGKLGAEVAGALVGGFVGLVAGFAATYLRYRDL
jgi:hypothetical protein